jgi:hypothetical protein
VVTYKRLDAEALYRELRRTLRRGARASRLLRYTPELVELLLPADEHPESTIYDRAVRTEHLLRQAIDSIGGPEGEALSILLCLKPGTTGMNLETRRQHAAELLGILPDTLRRDRHEGLLLWDVAMEVYCLTTPASQKQ